MEKKSSTLIGTEIHNERERVYLTLREAFERYPAIVKTMIWHIQNNSRGLRFPKEVAAYFLEVGILTPTRSGNPNSTPHLSGTWIVVLQRAWINNNGALCFSTDHHPDGADTRAKLIGPGAIADEPFCQQTVESATPDLAEIRAAAKQRTSESIEEEEDGKPPFDPGKTAPMTLPAGIIKATTISGAKTEEVSVVFPKYGPSDLTGWTREWPINQPDSGEKKK